MKYCDEAKQYEQDAKNQGVAGDKLIARIPFHGSEDVLDVGCGAGNLTALLAEKTKGSVVGIDASAGMIEQARGNYGETAIFKVVSGEELSEHDKYDLVFCNSVFHWFNPAEDVLKRIYRCLRKNGLFALQTTVENWCGILVEAIKITGKDEALLPYTSYYNNPWFHLEKAEGYRTLLSKNGFDVLLADDEKVCSVGCSLNDLVGLFNSGPALAYLNPDNYGISLPGDFEDRYKKILCRSLEKMMAGQRRVDVIYDRAYLLAKKADDKN